MDTLIDGTNEDIFKFFPQQSFKQMRKIIKEQRNSNKTNVEKNIKRCY